jgi:hypothetical protein
MIVVMQKTFLLLAMAALAHTACAQVLTTEVWIGALDRSEGSFVVSGVKNISNHPGYDNQPSFFPDGASLLYTTEAESLDQTGLGVHAVRYFVQSGKSVPLKTARGFSPTPAPDGQSFMTLREGTVWRYDLRGHPRGALLPLVKTAGYFTRIDGHRWVLYMNEKDRQIAIWDQSHTLRTNIVAGVVTAPYRVPGTRSVTFAVLDGDAKKLMRLDLTDDGGSLAPVLATIPFPTGGHHVWTSRGTLLMASGNTIHEWDPNHPEAWPVVHTFSEPDLQGITRIALSPAEDRIALVSTPNDMAVLRESRDASNKAFAAAVAPYPGVGYTRTPNGFAISGSKATERGTWVRGWRWHGRVEELRGDYTVTWQRTISANGTPAWSAETESYATGR